MYAVDAMWSVPGGQAEWMAGLEASVIPFITTLPGFVSARFTRNLSEQCNHSSLVFETKENAERFIEVSYPAPERTEARDDAGVKLLGKMAIHEVLVEVTAVTSGSAG
ncbi:hypothetical protein [Pseudarthrobacter albicanus]|uniref:hypothetical protein n=1 Tax=Pseudarthrobacter albicanus TaxID=2823873 RepID=UPI001BA52EF5|nr:hypothetical protein [Pseudarthrobacter albicanus]